MKVEDILKMNEIVEEQIIVFSCSGANRSCRCRTEGTGLLFTTDDPEEAMEHCVQNNSMLWMHPMRKVEYQGLVNSIELIKNAGKDIKRTTQKVK